MDYVNALSEYISYVGRRRLRVGHAAKYIELKKDDGIPIVERGREVDSTLGVGSAIETN